MGFLTWIFVRSEVEEGQEVFSDATVGRALSLRGLSVGETAARHSSLSKTSIRPYQTSKPIIGKHI